MEKQRSWTRIVLGYKCILTFDPECECYIISCRKFPHVLEDGRSSKEATVRMRQTLQRVIRNMNKNRENIPEMDEPEWEKIKTMVQQKYSGTKEEENYGENTEKDC